jgi:hypothetical protein
MFRRFLSKVLTAQLTGIASLRLWLAALVTQARVIMINLIMDLV